MKRQTRISKVFSLQSLGFLLVIALCWGRELFEFPQILLENPPFLPGELWSTILETILVLGVWLLVALSTRRVLNRLNRLEGFMRVCSWCRRIDYKGEWMPFEEFLDQSFDTPTTHGICDHCLEQQRASMKKHRTERVESSLQNQS